MQLTLIEDQRRDHSTFGLSLILHVGAIIFIVMIPLLYPDVIHPVAHHYAVMAIVAPQRELPKTAPTKAKLPPPKLTVAKVEFPKLVAPKPAAPPPRPPVIRDAHFDTPAVLSAPKNSLPRLVPAVHTGVLTGSSAPATVKAPVQKVQTGGFGDPNGLPPSNSTNANGKLIAAQVGSFDLPPGAGVGNGSGGTKGIRGTVASAGFGGSISGSGTGGGQSGSPRGGAVQPAGFATPQAAAAPHSRIISTAPTTQPVEITYKPNPIYTPEARQLRLEGEVLLDVIFTATGQVQVLQVVQGLGHGLDEAAVKSAQQIRFKPAMRDGQAVNSQATLHVRFQLAY